MRGSPGQPGPQGSPVSYSLASLFLASPLRYFSRYLLTSTELHPVRPTDNKQYGAYLCDLIILQGRPGRQGPQGAAGEKGSRVSGHSLVENLSLSNIYIYI